ncbi:MAG: SDR family NAD(P)-dependent oxidoreductase [Bacteroidales bacterium]|nr:SDR family NAD(P)-dependent oxidoreductase [Bacteroidales bacterium]
MSKQVLITGATDGIGKQAAIDLAKIDYQVIVHGRDESSVNQVINEIKEASGKEDLRGFSANLESLQEVKQLADQVRDQLDHLDILINNAGIFQREREITQDGYEKTFQVNYLSHYLLTRLLLDVLRKSDSARVVNVSSMVHATAIDFDNLQGEQNFVGSKAYGISKLCNVLFTYKLARETGKENITCNCLHPGVISTKLLKQNYGDIGNAVQEGSENIVYVATSEKVEGVSGKYFVNQMPQSSATVSYEPGVQDELWEISEKMVSGYLK